MDFEPGRQQQLFTGVAVAPLFVRHGDVGVLEVEILAGEGGG